MKTLVDFCLMTGRRVSRWVNRLLRRLAHKGQLRITLSIGIRLRPTGVNRSIGMR